MAILSWLSNLCRNLVRRRQIDRDIDDELRGSYALLVDEKIRAGLSPAEARRAAAIEFGGVEQVKDEVRHARTGAALDAAARDLRFALRMLAKSPGFTAAAVATLALGIGLNSTIFSFAYAVLKPLPLDNLPRLATVYMTDQRNPGERGVSRQNFADFRGQNDAFDELTAEGATYANLAGGEGEPERVVLGVVADNYFSTLGVKPLLGRGFRPEEDRVEGASLVAVLSYPLWQTRFGGDLTIVGKTISLNNNAFTVVGVMPPEFRGTQPIGSRGLWVPIMTYPITTAGQVRQGLSSRRFDWFGMTGRLKSGVTMSQAEANLKAVAHNLEIAYPNDNAGRSVGLRPLGAFNDFERRSVFTSIGMLMTVVGLVLFIACNNVANLMLARAAARQKEMAIRQALGASRSRLLGQVLTEGVLLALASGAAALLIARWGQTALWSYRPLWWGPNDIDLGINGQVISFTAIVSLLTCVLFALVPAIRASRPDLVAELKGQTSRVPGFGRMWNVRDILISAQVALSLVALVAAGLFIRSLQTVQKVDPRVDIDSLAAMRFDLGAQGYGEGQGRAFQRQALERASRVAGVESAILADLVPLAGGAVTRTVFIEGEDLNDRRNGRIVPTGIVSPGYFRTLGIPLIRGRDFSDEDRDASPPVAIVNERLASQLWPGQDPLGKRVKLFNTDFHQVVGIVRDTKPYSLGDEPTPILYRPLLQVYQSNLMLVVRSKAPETVLANVRNELQQLDRRLPITDAATMTDVLYTTLWAPRLAAWLLTLLAVVSLTLAGIGVYGVMAYSVGQRTRELGIRIALGATRGALVRLVVGQGLRLSLIGIFVGLIVALPAARLIGNLLYGSTTDPVTFALVPVVLAIAVVAASYLPARRAVRIPPTAALRTEA
jgi:predicted permease